MTGAELRRARLQMGKTQKQLAKQNGMDKSRICRLEAGTSDRMLKGYEAILNAYGFTIVRTLPDKDWNGYEEQ
jgi:transcriptional regulator with XRE-family HTH domain